MTEPVLCVCCSVLRRLRPDQNPRRPNVGMVCDSCRERMTADLASIPDDYAALDLERGRGEQGRLTGGFESSPPLNISALSLLGPGQDTPLARLEGWVWDWAGRLEQEPTTGMYPVCGWLSARLDWACNDHPAVDEFAQDVKDIAAVLRSHRGRDRGERVGNCPRQVGEQRCNTPLYVDPYVDEIQCTRCRQKWKRRAGEWMHLRAQQIAAGVEAA